jgi:hypothetical protein
MSLSEEVSTWQTQPALGSSVASSLAAYLDAIRHGAPPPVPGIAGLEELQFEVALRRSIEQRRPVEVQREFPLEG